MKVDSEDRIIAQVEFEGKPFNRKPDPRLPHTQERKVRIVGGLNETTSGIIFDAASLTPIYTSDLPHLPLSETDSMYDYRNVEGASLLTVRKRGASTPGVNMDEIFRQRGGNPDFSPLPTTGFALESSPREVALVRKRKRAQIIYLASLNSNPF